MKLYPQNTNSVMVEFKNGIQVLFSYQTPVAAFIPGEGYLRSSNKFSNTTTRHINAWMGKESTKTIDQHKLESIVGGI
jgi:hypothetical protein